MLPSLEEFIAYRHPQVIRSYMRTYQAEEAEATDLFVDMLKYLWASRKHMADREKNPGDESLDFVFVMHEEMRVIDNMWHNFILYTRDYTEFCHRNFGEYLHHQPDVAETMPESEGEFSTHMERYLLYVYDALGEETVRRWFAMHLPEAELAAG